MKAAISRTRQTAEVNFCGQTVVYNCLWKDGKPNGFGTLTDSKRVSNKGEWEYGNRKDWGKINNEKYT